MYDATITVPDPFPDRASYEGPDPTLFGIERVFSAGINTILRTEIGVKTEREYHLLSLSVNEAWRNDTSEHALERMIGAMDDLRYGMTTNPHMRVVISNGYYDRVSPYFSSTRFSRHMKLTEALARNLTVRHYPGGHMFYTWAASRRRFRTDIEALYTGREARSQA